MKKSSTIYNYNSDINQSTGSAELFARVTDPESLRLAFDRVRANGGGPGGDGQSIAHFARGLDLRLDRLSASLRHGTYRPGPLRHVAIPKKSGGRRLLAIPTVSDRVVQTAAASVLQPILEREFEDSSFAYRPGRSVQQAIARVLELGRAGFSYAIDADIERYFDNVPHAPLLRRLAQVVPDERLVELCALWLEEAESDGIGLPQGSPTSPLLANLYLDDVDEAIAAADPDIRLVRYADDFIVLCRSRARARSLIERVAAILAAHGLILNPEKTRLVSFAEGFRFLGQSIGAPPPEEPAPEPAEPLEPAAAESEQRPIAHADEIPATGAGTSLVPIVRPLYLLSPGLRLTLRNDTFSVEEDGTERLALPPRAVDRIELGPAADATAAALRHAMVHDIPVSFVEAHGGAVGHAVGRFDRHAERHLAQARIVLDPAARLDLARRIVEGRIVNQQRLLKRLNRGRHLPAVRNTAERLLMVKRKLGRALSIDEAMGHEGAAAQIYWPAISALLRNGFRLPRRVRHPAPDPVNAMLDWLSSMLTRDLAALILRHGLHPGFGALHVARDGGDAAAYDLIEEFRAPIVEALTVTLINNRYLGPEDFYQDDQAIRISRDGRFRIVREYERWLDHLVVSPRRKVRTTWRGVVEEQVEAYARHVTGKEPYCPYVLDF